MAARTIARGGGLMGAIRIALADDHRLVTRSLQAYLESFAGLEVVGTASSGEELLARIGEWMPDVVLQDLLLPGGIDGIETTRRIMERMPALKVIALTASVDEARMMAVLRAGAVGYVRKDADPEVLLAAIEAVRAGRTFIDRAAGRHVRGTAGADLTPRERDVLRGVALGHANQAIAEALGISHETVKTHVAHILAKLGVENRGQAAILALKRGVVEIDEIGS
jgi:NarL family two-component system response regulator LiaR